MYKQQDMCDLGQHANTAVKYYNVGMARYCKQEKNKTKKTLTTTTQY